MPRNSSTDTRFLEQKNGKWRVTIAVPKHLQAQFGTRLKRSLGTDSLSVANLLKWSVVDEFRSMIAGATSPADPLLAEALELARLKRRAKSEELEDIEAAIAMRAEQIGGKPIGSTYDPWQGESPVYDPIMERRAAQFVEVAGGSAVPIDLHHADYLKQISSNLTRRTVADDERAVRLLRRWCEQEGIPFMLQQITRRTAATFMDNLAAISGAPSTVTHRKYLTRLSRYWRWMLDRDIVEANPWSALKPVIKPTPYNEKERPFTDAEVLRLMNGPARPAMRDLMMIAALSGARLDTIVDLKVRDCAEGIFVFKPQKKEGGPRRVPVHSALADIVKRRCKAQKADDPVFPEWPPASNPESQRERSFKASNAFTTYRRAVGVDEVVPGKRRSLVNFHSFRRWFITRAEQAGQPENLIASVVGHTRPGMTLGRYSAGPQVAQLKACVEAVRLPPNEHPR